MQFTSEEWAEIRNWTREIADSQKVVADHQAVLFAAHDSIIEILEDRGLLDEEFSVIVDGQWALTHDASGLRVTSVETVQIEVEE